MTSVPTFAPALSDLREAIKREPADSAVLADLHAEIARLLLLEKHFQESLHACDRSLQINPKNSMVHRCESSHSSS